MVAITSENTNEKSSIVQIESLKGSKTTHANPSDWKEREKPTVLVLFDVDGTLTPARKVPHFPNKMNAF